MVQDGAKTKIKYIHKYVYLYQIKCRIEKIVFHVFRAFVLPACCWASPVWSLNVEPKARVSYKPMNKHFSRKLGKNDGNDNTKWLKRKERQTNRKQRVDILYI